MAEIAPRDRLLPSLLDRLTDNDPGSKGEAREFKVLSLRQLRQNVLRDLTWLLNTTCLEADMDLERWPAVRTSVLNFGMPALAGTCASEVNPRTLQQKIREAILTYEPRILANSIRVQAQVDANAGASHNVLSFKIQAQLWAQPAPIELLMRTDIDLETGQTSVTEAAR